MAPLPGIGGLVGGGKDDPATVYVAARPATNNNDVTSYSWSITPAARTGKWVVTFTTRGFAAEHHHNTATLNGVALTRVMELENASNQWISVWVSTTDITCDGTDTLAMTVTNAVSSVVPTLYAVDKVKDIANPVIVTDLTVSTLSEPLVLAVTIPEGGFCILTAVETLNTPSFSFSAGVSDPAYPSGDFQYSASGYIASEDGISTTVTITGNTGNKGAVAAIFR